MFARAGSFPLVRYYTHQGSSNIFKLRDTTRFLKQRQRTLSFAASPAVGASSGQGVGMMLGASLHPALVDLTHKLDAMSPRFSLQEGEIEILTDPAMFYSTLKSKILSAKKRIFLATLYIGKTETELIDCLRQALRENPSLEVFLLIDALRGTREAPKTCSASLMASLVNEFGERVQARLFHTPNLRGLKKLVIPQRLNEGLGLQHMKLYAFDDEIILSGANLSKDYFTNRQDRYYLFKSAKVTEYYAKIFHAISSLSYKLEISATDTSGFSLTWPTTNAAPEPTKRAIKFVRQATALLAPLLRPQQSIDYTNFENSQCQTLFYPVSQFSPLLDPNTSTESPAVQCLLDVLRLDRFSWMFTAGYFNIHPEYREKLLESNPKQGIILTAAPEANGFYKSPGISGALPPAYTLLARNFLRDVSKRNKLNSIHLLEWKNGVLNQPGGWTYHAKGIWVVQPEEATPTVTIIGSSNFTRRSHALDLESNAIIITRDQHLREKIGQEAENLLKFSKEMSETDYQQDDRKVSWSVRAALVLLGDML
ncbi:hypothetical protein V1511DRAFT_507350 [Dipodascopsis uninucleata]